VQKYSLQRTFIKKCLLFTVGSVCRVKRFIGGSRNVANVSLMTKRLKRRCEVAETTVKMLLCCGFRPTGKVMGQMYQCWWRIYGEINVFSRFEYHMFYVLYLFMTYLPTLPRRLEHGKHFFPILHLLKTRGYCIYHLLYCTKILHSCVSYGSHTRQRLSP
jgi:hypothetical protein